MVELGIYTFGEATPDPTTGRTPSPAERLRDLLEEIELADHGLKVAPVVREEVARRRSAAGSSATGSSVG